MKKILSRKEFINEAKSDYKVYHKRYSEVIDEIENYATSLGYELDQQEYGTAYVDAFFKPRAERQKVTLLHYIRTVKSNVKLFKFKYMVRIINSSLICI